ncbi:class I fructose-bisphosphate aldolase [Candidatus Woesebacteria bacterium]|nr:class I fructose-bisphosphate aldolase [Candidatus Woesebacteria bacterium]
MQYEDIIQVLGDEAEHLLAHSCQKIPKTLIHHTGRHHVEEIFSISNRSQGVLNSLRKLYGSGRLADTGYLSIFPVDQGMEHTAAYSFFHNPLYFDPETIIQMALEGGCNGVASTLGVLGLVSKKYAELLPFIVKINHSEHLTLPEKTDQLIFSSIRQARELGAVAVGATIYFGSPESHQQISQIAEAFELAHQVGLATILWCYPRNPNYTTKDADYADSVDITSQAIHIGVTMGADIVKQKMPTPTRGFSALKFSKYSEGMYDRLLTEHPIDLVRYQVAHAYMGKIGLINSGGESESDDFKQAVRTAVINKRAGGSGLIMGRKVFKRPFEEGVALLKAVQDVYLCEKITTA